MSLTSPIHAARRVAAPALAAALLLAATACGNGGSNQNATSPTSQQSELGGPGADGKLPGANGKVAAVEGSTAQVQGAEGQVAVTWDGSTTFTKDVSGTLADVKVGSCVLILPSGAPSTGSTPSAPPTAVTAASVRITEKTNGSCNAGIRGPGGPNASGGQAEGGPQLNGTPPSGAPQGGQRPQIRGGGGAAGEVTAVSASGFTVASVMPGSSETTSVTVTVGSDTTYSRTAAAAAADVKVGVCVAASGTTDATGAVTAKNIAVSQPVDGQCGGLVRFRSGDGASTQRS